METYSRLAARYYRALSTAHNIRNPNPHIRGFASSAKPTGSAGDHSGEDTTPSAPTGKPEETRDHYEPETGKREADKEETEHIPPQNKGGTERLVHPRAPYGSSPGLENIGVNNPAEPQIQQRREKSSASSTVLEEATCAGLDGTPWPEGKEKTRDDEEDDNEYYKHHKASPLSEIEIADTREADNKGDRWDSGCERERRDWMAAGAVGHSGGSLGKGYPDMARKCNAW